MTLQELKNYPYIVTAIKEYKNELAELYDDSAGSMSPDMSGMPHGCSASGSKVAFGYERNEKRIEELKDTIAKLKTRLKEIDKFFSEIEDMQTRLIFELRFKKRHTWKKISETIGGNNTENTVKKICYRYLEKNTEK